MSGKRRRHVPLRTCVSCRQVRPKRDMVRIVRMNDGNLAIDPKGKQSGRGTYICLEPGCGPARLSASGLSRALKCDVAPSQVVALQSALQAFLTTGPQSDLADGELDTE